MFYRGGRKKGTVPAGMVPFVSGWKAGLAVGETMVEFLYFAEGGDSCAERESADRKMHDEADQTVFVAMVFAAFVALNELLHEIFVIFHNICQLKIGSFSLYNGPPAYFVLDPTLRGLCGRR